MFRFCTECLYLFAVNKKCIILFSNLNKFCISFHQGIACFFVILKIVTRNLEIVFQIFEQTHQDKTEIQKEIKREGAEKNLLAEVAALYIARKHGVDVSEWYSVIEKSIVKENKV